ncbi:MAG: hypothetical protein HUU15_03720 [Candidatus Brocadiae bacterium]|nr:hypothetical protein [Candidatus Brocadiia bacterium]
MRTDVLKNREVQNLLKAKFVCAWKNIDGESTCGSSFAHEPADKPGQCSTGDGEHNTQICVFTPDGRLLTVMAGYQTPAELSIELDWVWDKVRPVALSEKLSDDQKATALKKMFADRIEKNPRQNHNHLFDQRYMTTHAYDHWTAFKVEDLVKGRGFGDHFFGRYGDKSMPGEGIGSVPESRMQGIDQMRLVEIKSEASQLRKRWSLAGDKARREIKGRLDELQGEYDELLAKAASKNEMRAVAEPKVVRK